MLTDVYRGSSKPEVRELGMEYLKCMIDISTPCLFVEKR